MSQDLPRYKSHKTVQAVKIAEIVSDPLTMGAWIRPGAPGVLPFRVSGEYVHRHNPQPGGYFVQYDDGYQAFSSAAAFEADYTKEPQ